jgi:hypothetical protein
MNPSLRSVFDDNVAQYTKRLVMSSRLKVRAEWFNQVLATW